VREHPQADVPRLRALVRGARQEREAGRPPKNFRALFQALNEMLAEDILSDHEHT
jgi:ribosome-associated protein